MNKRHPNCECKYVTLKVRYDGFCVGDKVYYKSPSFSLFGSDTDWREGEIVAVKPTSKEVKGLVFSKTERTYLFIVKTKGKKGVFVDRSSKEMVLKERSNAS